MRGLNLRISISNRGTQNFAANLIVLVEASINRACGFFIWNIAWTPNFPKRELHSNQKIIWVGLLRVANSFRGFQKWFAPWRNHPLRLCNYEPNGDVRLAGKTRANSEFATAITKEYISWGAGPRASQNLIIGAKCHAALKGKYSPDIEDVKAVAQPILRHRLVRNYKAEADGFSMERIISEIL